MSTTSKKHCYTVTIRRAENLPGLRYHVIAESKAQAKAAIANTMIVVERTDPIDLLDLRRDQVIDATEVVAPATGSEEEQPALPLADPTSVKSAEPDPVDKAVAAFTDDAPALTAAQEAGDTPA